MNAKMLPGIPMTYQTGVTYRSIASMAGHFDGAGLDSELFDPFDVIAATVINSTKHPRYSVEILSN